MTKYDQLFVTHCLASDSVLGEAGYSIRATSLKSDDPLLSLAMNLTPFELPIMAYDGARPYPWEAPIRLAAIPLKETGLVAIMHSVYRETDTRGRPNSYFTHVIFVPKEEFSWRTTLKTWGAIQWEMPDVSEDSHEVFNPPRWITQWPNHATSELPKLRSLPESGLNEFHFEEELYEYYLKNPKSLEIVLGAVLIRLKKKDEPKNGAEPIRGYLLPRDKIKENQCEGYYPNLAPDEDNDIFWPKAAQFRFDGNIRETFMQLAFIAWFFPEKLLNDQGFSTYEPHKYGVSIANDKLLIGIVHAKGESPDEMMIGQGVEYYSVENENSLAVDASDEIFKWGKQQIKQVIKNKNILNFSKEMDQVYESFKKSGWDYYQKSKELFDAIKDYEKKTSFNNVNKLLNFAITNDYALEKFIYKQDRVLPDLIDECFKFHEENKEKEFLEIVTLFANTKFFNWANVCKHLSANDFLELPKKDTKLAARFAFFKKILTSSISDINKVQLKSYLKTFLFNDSCLQIWKSNQEWIWELFNFYYKIDDRGLAKHILSIISCEMAIASILQQWKKNKSNDLVDWLTVLPWLMELLIKNDKSNKKFEALYKDESFVLMLVEITNNNNYKDWKKFFRLCEINNLETLAKTSIDGIGMPLTSQLMKFLLNDEKTLPDEIINRILFSGNMPIIVKIIHSENRLPYWVLEKIEIFLEKVNPENYFLIAQPLEPKTTEDNYQFFLFETLFDQLSKAQIVSAQKYSFIKLMEILEALVAVKKYASNIPYLFEIDEFEQHLRTLENWGGKQNKGLRRTVIDHLATKVKEFEDEENGYDKAHGKFVLLILSLNHPDPVECFTYLNEKGIFLFDVHFKFIPQILQENGNESKINLAYSMLKNKWVYKLGAIKLMDSEFLKVKKKIGNRFRLEYMPIAKVYDFFGEFFTGKSDEKYQNGRLVALILFFLMFFIPPLWHLIFTGANPVITGYLTGFKLLHAISFNLVVLLWGCSDFFSKANNLVKPEQYNKNMYINWKIIGVALWSIFGVVLSACFYLSPKFGVPFFAILTTESIWFVVYKNVIYREDPIDVFLKPGTCIIDLDS